MSKKTKQLDRWVAYCTGAEDYYFASNSLKGIEETIQQWLEDGVIVSDVHVVRGYEVPFMVTTNVTITGVDIKEDN